MISLDLMVPPAPVVPLGLTGWIGYVILFVLAIGAMVAAGLLTPHQDLAALAVLGAATLFAIPAILRFFRAVGPGDRLHFWMLMAALAVSAAVIGATVSRRDVAWAVPTVGAWGLAALVAAGIDKWQEYMASIPVSWGVLLGLTVLGFAYIGAESQSR